MDLWFSQWSQALGQAIAIYGTKTGQSGHGHRTSAQYLMLQPIYFSGDSRGSFGFINDQNGDNDIVSWGTETQGQTWFTLKV